MLVMSLMFLDNKRATAGTGDATEDCATFSNGVGAGGPGEGAGADTAAGEGAGAAAG